MKEWTITNNIDLIQLCELNIITEHKVCYQRGQVLHGDTRYVGG